MVTVPDWENQGSENYSLQRGAVWPSKYIQIIADAVVKLDLHSSITIHHSGFSLRHSWQHTF